MSQYFLQVLQAMAGGAHGLGKYKEARVSVPTAATETDSGIVLPAKAVVTDVWIDVITVDATETVAVGTDSTDSGDANGYLTAASLATAGLVRPIMTNGALTRGALLVDDEDGAGALVPVCDVASGGKKVTVTTSAGTDTAVFDVYVAYYEV